MTSRAWIAALTLGLLPGYLLGAAEAETPDGVEFEGTAQLRTSSELWLKLWDGRVQEIPAAVIGQMETVAPGALIQLKKTTAAPGAAKAAAEKARLVAEEAKKAADDAKAAEGGPKPIAEAARLKSTEARSAADAAASAAAAAAEKALPLQAMVIGAQVVGTVQQVADDQSWLVLRSPPPPKRPWPATWDIDTLLTNALTGENADRGVLVSIQVGTDLRALVKSIRPGDGVKAVYRYARNEGTAAGDGAAPSNNALKQLEWRKARVGVAWRWASLLGVALLLLVVAAIVTRGTPTRLYLGEDNRYSSSKFQTVLWFWVVISTYLAIVLQRLVNAGPDYIGGVDIPANLLMLSGLSVLGVTGAKLITTSKEEAAKAGAGTPAATNAKQSADAPAAGDLINDDFNRTDLGDFQMITVTGIAVAMYAVSAVEFMSVIELRRVVTMPEVDATLLALFGLSQAGYLGKKAAGGAGAGLTPQQAIERADALVATIKTNTKKVEESAKVVAQQATAASSALAAVTAAVSKATAEPEAAKAKAAAEAASKAQSEAAAAFQTVQTQFADLSTLATTWVKDRTAGPRTQAASADAKAEQAKAETAAADATKKVSEAKKTATSAQSEAAGKTP